MTVCSGCGHESLEGFKFCPECGAPAEAASPMREVRKVVTIVFCDLSGSTALGDRTDPEALRTTLRGYYEQMRAILERHGGTVEKFVGDAVMAVFGVPVSHEGDALRAVRAAWEMRAAVTRLGLEARIGVNTGEVVTGEGDTLVTGDAVNVAARLEQGAGAGEVMIGAATRRLVRDATKVEPASVLAKGKPNPVEAFRLLDVDLAAEGFVRRLDTPLVGRTSELRQLQDAFARAVRERRCQLFTLLGSAGVGKSRLTAEFVAALDANVLHGRCLDYGEGITFWPVVSVLKQLGPRADATLAQLADGGSSQNELFWAIRTRLEEAALERPLVVVFDDIQWGEPTFLDLLDHVADLSRGAPILMLCLARPDLLDRRPGWGGGKLNTSTTLLEPLSREECDELIESHGEPIGAETRARILQAADGNPLFVEEMLALARESDDVRVPSTVQALLQARLDQLGTDERSVIERGAVEGQVFHRGAVLELAPGANVELELIGLVRKELIRPETSTFAGDHAFRFRHLLIRDAAYDALPKEMRAELHERFATWLASHGQELIELDEILGHHLEQAGRYRRELGLPHADVERRAALCLASAGTKAAARSDLPAADNLLARALELLAPDDPRRLAVVLERVAALDNITSDERSLLIAELENHSNPVARMHGTMARLQQRLRRDPQSVVDEAQRISEEALEVFTAAGDELGTARAWLLLFWVYWLRSQGISALAALEASIEHAERAGARALVASASVYLLGPLLHAPLTPEEVRVRTDRLREAGGPLATNIVLRVEAEMRMREGRIEEAMEAHERANAILSDLGLTHLLSIFGKWPAELLLRQGRTAESVVLFREAVANLEELAETSFRSTSLLRLAEALYRNGEPEEAERRAIEGEELGAEEDVVNFALGRGLRARIAADRGDHAAAEILSREAIEYAFKTDFPWTQAEAHSALGHTLAAAGRIDEASTELEHAIDCFERRGDVVEAERTRRLLATPADERPR